MAVWRRSRYEHEGGKVYLAVNSACSWTITAVAGAQGRSNKRTSHGSTLLDVHGDGIVTTRRFDAPGEWKINYSFSHCQIPGFDIYVEGDVFDIMSKGGSSGHGTQYEHQGGSVYLSINTACSWHVTATR